MMLVLRKQERKTTQAAKSSWQYLLYVWFGMGMHMIYLMRSLWVRLSVIHLCWKLQLRLMVRVTP